MLARNMDIEGAVNAVREMEDRFNRNFNYPWVFLNDEPFSDEFKRCVVGFSFKVWIATSDNPPKPRVESGLGARTFWPGSRRPLAPATVD